MRLVPTLDRSRWIFLITALWVLCPAWGPSAWASEEEDEDSPTTYADIVPADAVTEDGLLKVHRVEDKLLFEIPQDLFDRDMLLVSRVARVPADLSGGFMAAGHKTAEQVVRWERVEGRILLRKVSYRNVADEEQPIYRSVVNNNFFPILAAFEIEVEGPASATGEAESTTAVIDVSDFFEEDVPAISGLAASVRERYEIKSLDGDRSFINYAHAYPLNVEVRHTLTFKASEPPVDASTETLSLEMHQSMVLLPEEPMRPRYADSRVGWFTVRRTNFGLDKQKAANEEFLRRWRLEPRDPAAYARGELVEPVKPIVYYLDPATPEQWRPYVRQGVLDWQEVFETAGFRNAILVKDPPSPEEDPRWNGEDVRYSMVRWAANRVRNAMGPSVSDPRSGEIIESDIVWYHNHMRSYRNRLMLETGAANPLARSLPIDQEFLGEAIRQVIAHEVGHALGLPHNMIASAAYPVESLRDPEFAARMGVSASIMEYARQNYVAQPGDGLRGADFIRRIGVYDHYAINWGYRVIPGAATPEDEKAILDGWILEKADDPMYRYGPQRGGLPIDPRIQTEDLGDDSVLASGYGIANLKRVAPRLVEWTASAGEDYTDLRELYGELLGQYRRYCSHVVSVVGGVYQNLKSSDQEGVVHQAVPAAKQRQAMEFLADNVWQTPEWLLDPQILRRIQHGGEVQRIGSIQAGILNRLLDPGRLQRLVEAEAMLGRDAYSLAQFLEDLRQHIWGPGRSDSDAYRRTLQRAHLKRLEWLMTEEPAEPSSSFVQRTPVELETSDIRALVRAQLHELREETRRRASRSRDATHRAHYLDASERIEAFLQGRALH